MTATIISFPSPSPEQLATQIESSSEYRNHPDIVRIQSDIQIMVRQMQLALDHLTRLPIQRRKPFIVDITHLTNPFKTKLFVDIASLVDPYSFTTLQIEELMPQNTGFIIPRNTQTVTTQILFHNIKTQLVPENLISEYLTQSLWYLLTEIHNDRLTPPEQLPNNIQYFVSHSLKPYCAKHSYELPSNIISGISLNSFYQTAFLIDDFNFLLDNLENIYQLQSRHCNNSQFTPRNFLVHLSNLLRIKLDSLDPHSPFTHDLTTYLQTLKNALEHTVNLRRQSRLRVISSSSSRDPHG